MLLRVQIALTLFDYSVLFWRVSVLCEVFHHCSIIYLVLISRNASTRDCLATVATWSASACGA